ncbi:type 2 periplasmic-binding domain-containing protein [Rubrivivax gelatinosus]|uniref:hypothetical protein n=1 Tax=Rubrivivax gelatinosus TaxID=28068 RepID=UPI001907B3AE|nr:hypothetical protein [Rubrivivax gelatinosus]
MSIVCREWRLDRLLSGLATHTLDLVIADAPRHNSVSVKAFSHHLGGSAIGVFAAPSLQGRRGARAAARRGREAGT